MPVEPSEMCPNATNHLVEWPDHVHFNGKCYALIETGIAEKLWAYLNTHIGDGDTYNAEIDELHSYLDDIKHGE